MATGFKTGVLSKCFVGGGVELYVLVGCFEMLSLHMSSDTY